MNAFKHHISINYQHKKEEHHISINYQHKKEEHHISINYQHKKEEHHISINYQHKKEEHHISINQDLSSIETFFDPATAYEQLLRSTKIVSAIDLLTPCALEDGSVKLQVA
ncbi:hypothetical protein CDAR_532661 [Caerostris darwini]|uniref:Uncharacterized protein n=1 Tax=Caerostris darwini TaxID=1538125 RepID=A0AAV4VXZ4_9ARAC|nr:hypothetical protein CDAR_532661 [Caerostris darwini]